MPRPVLRLFAISVVARTPLAAVGLLLIVRTNELTGSYAASGAVAGAATIANALSAPALGRLVDRRGHTAVLRACAVLASVALAVFAALPAGAAVGVLVALSAACGIAMPPLGACLRTLYPMLLEGDRLHRAYALESAALELTYIVGPLLLLGVASGAGAPVALFIAAAILAGGTIAFASQRESRAWRAGPPAPSGGRGGAIRSRGLQTIMIAVALAAATFGAVEVAVPAACQAAHAKGAIGPLLAVWGLGSMLGGIAAARAAAPSDAARWLAVLLAALGIGDLALVPFGSPAALAPLLLVAGAAVAPLLGTANSLIDRVAPDGRQTEAFAWLATAIGSGLAAGSAIAGVLVDAGGAGAGFATASAAGLLACAITSARRSSLAAPAPA